MLPAGPDADLHRAHRSADALREDCRDCRHSRSRRRASWRRCGSSSRPGLYSNEKKLAIPFIALSSLFFIGGAAFAHYVVFPLTFKFFGSFSSDTITFMPRIEPAFALYMKLVLIFGLRLPDADGRWLLLARLGLITAASCWRNFKVRGAHHLHHRRRAVAGHRIRWARS